MTDLKVIFNTIQDYDTLNKNIHLLTSRMSDTITICNCEGTPHLLKLDMVKVRKAIPHTKGEHPPYQGKLLCNGHCKWDGKCDPQLMCIACEYIECWGCAEDFGYDMEEKVYPEYDGYGYTYCRNCGYHNKTKEVSGKKEYFDIINPWTITVGA